MSLYESTLAGTGTRSYPEVAALRLLVELRASVGQLSSELSRRHHSGSDTMRIAVLKLSKVARHAGIETSRTTKMRTAYGQIEATLRELARAAQLAALPTYVRICERVCAQLELPIRDGDVPPSLLDVLYEWINASLQYLGATPAEDDFPEAHALVAQLFDARWESLFGENAKDSLTEGLTQERRQRQAPTKS